MKYALDIASCGFVYRCYVARSGALEIRISVASSRRAFVLFLLWFVV